MRQNEPQPEGAKNWLHHKSFTCTEASYAKCQKKVDEEARKAVKDRQKVSYAHSFSIPHTHTPAHTFCLSLAAFLASSSTFFWHFAYDSSVQVKLTV